uniref:Uncharacterized protein n=1 Tax=Arundo donax TaxID=35708 RepID=A0A0A9BIK1_ARUDO
MWMIFTHHALDGSSSIQVSSVHQKGGNMAPSTGSWCTLI